jgi:hypothetical protein
MGITANNKRLLATYNPDNCALWGECDNEECKERLGKLNDKIKEFKCPFTEGDRDQAMRLYQNTNEDTGFMFPGDGLGLSMLPVAAVSIMALVLIRNMNEN